MELDKAIEHALDGNAVLFTGAGFSTGATNLRSRPFRRGSELAEYFLSECGLPGGTPLDDAAEAFAEKYGDERLINEVKLEFTVKGLAQHHQRLAQIPWKRVYTTNYDNVLETAYTSVNRRLKPITLGVEQCYSSKDETLCIHLNGHIDRLNPETVWTEFKLTESSYVAGSLSESEWAVMLRQDIRLARAVVFVGYSLVDLDVKRILFDSAPISDKCVFILGPHPEPATLRRASRFGTPVHLPVKEFAERITTKKESYRPIALDGVFLSVREHKVTAMPVQIPDQAFIDLLLLGRSNDRLISESFRSGKQYFMERSETQKSLDAIEQGCRTLCVCSDLGNGKSMFLSGLRHRALERGFRVFEVKELSENAASELEAIAKVGSKVLVTIDNYQGWLREIRIFRTNCSPESVLVLATRTSVHDVVIDDLTAIVNDTALSEVNLDNLNSEEIQWFSDALTAYGLWGAYAGSSPLQKARFLRRECLGQIHAILLNLLNSPDIGGRYKTLFRELKRNTDYRDVAISIFILTILGETSTVDTLADLWGDKVLGNVRLRKNALIRQLIDFNGQEFSIRSSVAAQYLLKSDPDAAVTIDVLSRMMGRLHDLGRSSRRYQQMFVNLMKFSNVQFLLPEEGRRAAVVTYYESVKNLPKSRDNPLFWLQYAIACLVTGEMFRAKKYFDTAYSLAEKTRLDTYQIDNHYARYLLVEAVQGDNAKAAMDNFRQARGIVARQMKNERMHHPYRVAIAYAGVLERFAQRLSPGEVQELVDAASSVLTRIAELPEQFRQQKYVRECKNNMEYMISHSKEIKERKPPATNVSA